MTTLQELTKTQEFESFYKALSNLARAALLLKLSIDNPGAIEEDFASTLKISDKVTMSTENLIQGQDESLTRLIEKNYPELGQKLIDEVTEIVCQTIFASSPEIHAND